MFGKKYALFWIIGLIILSSGCNETIKTTDLLHVDYLNIYPSGILNTNDIAQIRMRITNTGQSPAKMILEERKIKRYYLWKEKNGMETIIREGNSWFKWDGTNVVIKKYAEYIIKNEGKNVTLIAPDRTETDYNIQTEYITLVGGEYEIEPYELTEKSADELALDSGLPEYAYDSSEFKASSVLVQYCGSLYNIESFIINPGNGIELFKENIKSQTAGSGNIVYSQSVIVGRRILINPKDSVELVWKIKAPSNEETAGLMQPCTFRFNVKYSAEAKSESHIYFANPLEIIQQSITDNEMEMKGTTVRTYGPMAIEIEPTSKQPIRSSTGTSKNKWTIKLIVLNKGAGYGHINTLSLKVNKDAENIFRDSGKENSELNGFYCDFENNGNMLEMKDTMNKNYMDESGDLIDAIDAENRNRIILNKLDIYKDKTSEIRCTMAAPTVNIMEPYMFTAKADYDYILQGYINVKTKPDREI